MHRSILLALLLSPIGAAFADGLYSDLLQAAGTGDVAQVQALLAQGSDPNLPSGVVGRSALAYAVFFKQVETITVLLEEVIGSSRAGASTGSSAPNRFFA